MLARRLRSFARDRRGATALEFSLVAFPFLLIMFAAFEYILIYLVTISLDSATLEAARQIRTGELQQQTGGITAAKFKALVCSNMGWMSDSTGATGMCNDQLSIDVRTFGQFAGDSPPPLSDMQKGSLMFDVGGPGAIVMVTTFFKWNLLTPALQTGFSNMGTGIDVISTRAVFRNEPYQSTST